jgi:hypothetical protein
MKSIAGFSAAIILITMLAQISLRSQCSDAGIMIIGQHNPEVLSHEHPDKVKLDYNIGYSGSDGGDIVYNKLIASTDLVLFSSTRLEAALPLVFNTGPTGTTGGLGDAIAVITTYIPLHKLGVWGISLGGKFATGSTTQNDLPQSYQPGLGSNDLLFGIGSNVGAANVYFAYQKPYGRSKNQLTQLKRGDDIMLRFGYGLPVDKTILQAEFIAVKQLQNSSVIVPGSDPVNYTEVDGTNQLQIDLTGRVWYNINTKFRFEAYVSIPLLKRDFNFDGLKRTFSVSASFAYIFHML